MRICLSVDHVYPGKLRAKAAPAVHDNLALGLAEAGHEVFYNLAQKPEVPLPEGVVYTPAVRWDVDILHLNAEPLGHKPRDMPKPWVKTVHIDVRQWGLEPSDALSNWIYVSQTLARAHGSHRFVLNGVHPDEFIYSETKEEYLLFLVCGLHRAMDKGLDIAARVARKAGIELRVAASGRTQSELDAFAWFCRKLGAVSVGPAHGQKKAELLAGARALLFPSRLNEAFGLVIAEALISGTPVIASARGAIPEILDPTTGFVCQQEEDYVQAVANCGQIRPQHCRSVAMERFHYRKMTDGYLREYEREIRKREQDE
jgi:glycosyltransferase involved in cell wall biosynthesis